MAGRIEGEGPRGEPTSQPAKPTDQLKPLQEGGNGSPGLPPTLHERAKPPPESSAHGRGEITSVQQPESHERQPLPNVWDVLEREVRLWAPDVENRPRYGTEEYMREFDEMDRLEEELIENGTPREKLIIELYSRTKSRSVKPPRIGLGEITLEQFHQLRSQVDPMSTEEIAEEVRKLNEERHRKWEEYHERHKDDPPTMAYH
jgi:hypothetical protein